MFLPPKIYQKQEHIGMEEQAVPPTEIIVRPHVQTDVLIPFSLSMTRLPSEPALHMTNIAPLTGNKFFTACYEGLVMYILAES
jgi:hypothetical protein